MNYWVSVCLLIWVRVEQRLVNIDITWRAPHTHANYTRMGNLVATWPPPPSARWTQGVDDHDCCLVVEDDDCSVWVVLVLGKFRLSLFSFFLGWFMSDDDGGCKGGISEEEVDCRSGDITFDWVLVVSINSKGSARCVVPCVVPWCSFKLQETLSLEFENPTRPKHECGENYKNCRKNIKEYIYIYTGGIGLIIPPYSIHYSINYPNK